MKIAVISDIHANKMALDAVLKDIEDFDPDKLFCLGDVVLAGYDPNGVCDRIYELMDEYRASFNMIQGNTDKMIVKAYEGDEELINRSKEGYPCMGYSLEQDIKITDKRYIEFLKNLEERQVVDVNGLKIELCHGSPRNQSENIYPELRDETVCEMVKDSKADVILCGHTHIPCGYSLSNSKTVINVGSVGRPMTKDKMPTYLQITVDKYGTMAAEHKTVKYDNVAVSKKILERGFNHAEDLAKMYLSE